MIGSVRTDPPWHPPQAPDLRRWARSPREYDILMSFHPLNTAEGDVASSRSIPNRSSRSSPKPPIPRIDRPSAGTRARTAPVQASNVIFRQKDTDSVPLPSGSQPRTSTRLRTGLRNGVVGPRKTGLNRCPVKSGAGSSYLYLDSERSKSTVRCPGSPLRLLGS